MLLLADHITCNIEKFLETHIWIKEKILQQDSQMMCVPLLKSLLDVIQDVAIDKVEQLCLWHGSI